MPANKHAPADRLFVFSSIITRFPPVYISVKRAWGANPANRSPSLFPPAVASPEGFEERSAWSRMGVIALSQRVGLLRDERHDGLDQKPSPSVFLPLARVILAADSNDGRALQQISVVVSCAGAPTSIVDSVRNIAHRLNPSIPIYGVETLEERLDDSLWARRAYSWLFEGFAVLAVILAMAGVYGTMSYTVNQRVQEYGIRMALGATGADVLRLVLVQGATLVLSGIAFGLTNAWWATSLLRSLLFGVSSHDLAIYGLAVLSVSIAGPALVRRSAEKTR
jgi:hypothetical protein